MTKEKLMRINNIFKATQKFFAEKKQSTHKKRMRTSVNKKVQQPKVKAMEQKIGFSKIIRKLKIRLSNLAQTPHVFSFTH